MRSQLVLFSFAAFAAAIILATAGGYDEWEPIKDPKDDHVKKIAEFAVEKHDEKENGHLKLDEVVTGKYRKVHRHRTKYKLVLAATDEKKEEEEENVEEELKKDSKHYEAVVVEKVKEDEQRLRLILFKPAKK